MVVRLMVQLRLGVVYQVDSFNVTGDMTIDVAGDIILDADGGDVTIKDGGTKHRCYIKHKF